MESKLPKLTGLKRPAIKPILPTERTKSNSAILKDFPHRFPSATRDFQHSSAAINGRRSPELHRPNLARPKLRRSLSTCDMTEHLKANCRILKEFPGKTLPLTRDLSNLGQSSISGRRSPSAVKPTMSRAKLRRSRSASDLSSIVRSKPLLKRPTPTLAPIPAKIGRTITSANSSNTSSNSSSASSRFPKNPAVGTTKPGGASQDAGGVKKAAPKRIPPYDYKARFNDLLEKHKVLKEKYEEARDQLVQFDNLPEQYEECQAELYKAKEECRVAKSDIECLQRQTKAHTLKIDTLTKCLTDTKEELSICTKKYEDLLTEHNSMTSELFELRESCISLTEKVDTLSTDVVEYKEQLFRYNIERKELHNAVMDLRGNIRVFCRVRPPLSSEEDRPLCGWNYLDETSLEISSLEILASGNRNKVGNHEFRFDHVFHPRTPQEDIFEMVSPLIQSALDGYNICIFAYGQTGSGKTFTMDGVPENLGVIPRTVDLLFESIRNYKRLGWEYEIRATFLEIYNEVLYDLLSNEQKDMEIRMAKNKSDIYVSNITEEVVDTANRLRYLMNIAKMNRATASTAGNERSSRSHAVTRIELIGTHQGKGEVSVGTINLVDLAGSESPKTSTRMNETKNINRSLSELTNVILALLQKQDHIPYRNSKLTHLLMPSLGGNSKTLMFINVSPFQDCFVESVKSLRFAANVNSCKSNKAKKNKFLSVDNSIG